MSSDEIAIRARDLSKHYLSFNRPQNRLKQSIVPRLQRLAGRKPKQYYHDFVALSHVSFDLVPHLIFSKLRYLPQTAQALRINSTHPGRGSARPVATCYDVPRRAATPLSRPACALCRQPFGQPNNLAASSH